MTIPVRLAWLGLYLSLVLPSVAQVAKYAGLAGIVLHAALVAAVLGALPRLVSFRRISERTASAMAVAVWVLVCVLFAVGFPIANSGLYGPGSDTDEAYDFAVREMLAGNYPYYVETYLWNAVHHLPGALILAAPFVLLGTSALQNLAWLPLFYLVARRELKSSGEALVLWVAVLVLCPAVIHGIVTGTDGGNNGLAVLVGMWAVIRSRGPWLRAAATVLFALALSNRVNFILAVPPVFAVLAAASGRAAALRWVTATVALLAVINLPFYFRDPDRFTPFEGFNRVTRLDMVIPYARYWVPGLAILSTLALSFRVRTFMSAVALVSAVQAFLVTSGAVIWSVDTGRLDLAYAGYGTFFVFSGTLAAWLYLKHYGELRYG